MSFGRSPLRKRALTSPAVLKMNHLIRAVIDTNVVMAALRSSSGASYQILLAADRGDLQMALSVPLLAEYDDVASRPDSGIIIPASAVNAIIRRIAMVAHKQQIYFLWRPILSDPKDDMILEVAIASGASHIVTFNQKDLRSSAGVGGQLQWFDNHKSTFAVAHKIHESMFGWQNITHQKWCGERGCSGWRVSIGLLLAARNLLLAGGR